MNSRVFGKLSYLYGIKRYLTESVLTVLVNCNIHSLIDYGIEFWAVQTSAQLKVIQSKVDSFICTYFLPIICKKAKKRKLNRDLVKTNLQDIRLKFNLFTLEEWRDLFLLKHAYRYYCNPNDNVRRSRSWPLLTVPFFNTKFGQNCAHYRSTKLWNALPRDWVIADLSYSNFVSKCKKLIISRRQNEFLFF